MSPGSRTSRDRPRNPKTVAAPSVARYSPSLSGSVVFQRSATCDALGSTALSSSSRLAPSSGENEVTPVMLPPGCAMLVTSPVPTGSATMARTIGRVVVTAFAAWGEGGGSRGGGGGGGGKQPTPTTTPPGGGDELRR